MKQLKCILYLSDVYCKDREKINIIIIINSFICRSVLADEDVLMWDVGLGSLQGVTYSCSGRLLWVIILADDRLAVDDCSFTGSCARSMFLRICMGVLFFLCEDITSFLAAILCAEGSHPGLVTVCFLGFGSVSSLDSNPLKSTIVVFSYA